MITRTCETVVIPRKSNCNFIHSLKLHPLCRLWCLVDFSREAACEKTVNWSIAFKFAIGNKREENKESELTVKSVPPVAAVCRRLEEVTKQHSSKERMKSFRDRLFRSCRNSHRRRYRCETYVHLSE